MSQMYFLLLSLVIIVVADATTSCNCEPRYLKHYETKGCTPVLPENSECQCPIRFNCPELHIDPNVCKLDGITYAIGDPVNTSNNCEICNCRTDFFHSGAATIQCIGIECGPMFQPSPVGGGCYMKYEEEHCCPQKSCEPKTPETKVCEHNGKEYRVGQKIYSETDPCLTCTCTENWTGINSGSCRAFKCDLDKQIYNFKRGCIPIYHEKTCCPIEYHCPPDDGTLSNETISQPPNAENLCYFNGAYYGVGETLDISHPTSCVTCTCSTPPDFTCVHRSCPGPPNNDWKNCQANYAPNTCCAEFTCTPSNAADVDGVLSGGGGDGV